MQPLDWSEIPGWEQDDHAAAWAAFAITAHLTGQADANGRAGAGFGAAPPSSPEARRWFEQNFAAYEVAAPGGVHFTGYYEPELAAATRPSARFPVPLHALPAGLPALWHPRAVIGAQDLLAGHEIAYVENAIEAFLAQVQGSVRLRLDDGRVMRLGYAGKNGQPYRSIGAELVRRGVAPAAEMTPDRIRQWCRDNPDLVQGLLNHNPSYVFFRQLDLPEGTGPLGATGTPVRAGRSLAVDPAVVALGLPVWIDCPGFGRRLMVAQDTGSAIRGVGRGDIFLGSGTDAGRRAGAINHRGRMVVLRERGQ